MNDIHRKLEFDISDKEQNRAWVVCRNDFPVFVIIGTEVEAEKARSRREQDDIEAFHGNHWHKHSVSMTVTTAR